MKQNATFAFIAVAIIAVVLLVLEIPYYAPRPANTALEPSPSIPSVPITRSTPTVNPPPKPIPPEIRCNWFVICGRYVILEDYKNSTSIIGKIGLVTLLEVDFKAGDYVEISEFGLALMSGNRESYGGPRRTGELNSVCYPRSGRWHAERLPLANNSKNYTNVVSLELGGSICDYHLKPLKCDVKMSPRPEGIVGTDQLACDDGSKWVLCNRPESRTYMKEYCEPVEVNAYAKQARFTTTPSGSINLTLAVSSGISGEVRLVVADEAYEFLYPMWERMKLPSGFTAEGNQRTIRISKGQTIEIPIKIVTTNAQEGVYRLTALVYYEIKLDNWKHSGSSITVTVQR